MEFNQNQHLNSKLHDKLDSSSNSSLQNQPLSDPFHQSHISLYQRVTSAQKIHEYFHQFLSPNNPYLQESSLQLFHGSFHDEKNTQGQSKLIFTKPFEVIPQFQYFQISDQSKKTEENQIKFMQNYQSHYSKLIEKDLLRSERFKKSKKFTKNLLVHEFYPSKHYQVVKLQIQLLWYKTQILILNELSESPLQNFQDISGSGSFGYVYFVNILDEQLAIKSISFQNDNLNDQKDDEFNHFRNKILAALKQYFFLLLFSELQIGPKVKMIGGFNMVIFKDCIVFGSQICNQINKKQCDFRLLHESLFKMHMLQIVHRDIKPTNIMFSESFGKFVFIDFGCSEVLDEPIGYKTLTKFVGTTAFCTDELLGLLSQLKGMADLYYNDYYGLIKSIHLKGPNGIMELQMDEKMYIQLFEFDIYRMKYLLYVQNYTEFRFVWKLVNMNWWEEVQQIEIKLLKFYPQLRPNDFLKQFFWTEISEINRQNPDFKGLVSILKNQNSQAIFYFCREFIKQNSYHFYESFYKSLPVSNRSLNQQEKQIQAILSDKKALKLRVFRSDIKTEIHQSPLKQQSVISYFLFVAKYCQIGLNEYQIDIDSKIKACEKALTFVKKIDPLSKQKLLLIFDCPNQKYQLINYFYHYFLTQIWPNLTSKHQQQLVPQIVSTLCFLGFPVESKISIARVLLYFIDSKPSANLESISSEIRMEKIIFYWEIRLTFLIFQNIFYNRAKNKSKIQHDQQFQNYSLMIVKKLIEGFDHQKDRFFKINQKFHKCLLLDHLNFDQKVFAQLYEILSGPIWRQPEFQTYKIKKWRYLMQISLCYISFIYKIKDAWKAYESMEQVMFFAFKYNKSLLPYLISFIYAEVLRTYKHTNVIFQKIDQMVNCRQLSLRFEIQYRFILSLQKDDINTVYDITDIIMNEIQTSEFEVQNMNMLQKIMQCIYCFILNCLKNKNHLTRTQAVEIVRCYEFFKMNLQVGLNYNKWNNKKNLVPLSKLHELVISVNQIEMLLAESILIRSFFLHLLKIGQIFKKLDESLRNHPMLKIIQFKLPKSGQKATLEKILLEQKYISFLKQIPKNVNIFNFVMPWIQVMKFNEQVRKQIKQNRTICLQFVAILINQKKILDQDVKTNQIINELFGKITALSYDTDDSLNLPNEEIIFDYFYLKINLTDYNQHWCQQVITLYKITLKRGTFQKIVHKQGLMRTLFNCFIKTNKTYDQIQQLIFQYTLSINDNPIIPVVKSVQLHLNKFFWCQCEKCIKERGQHWNIIQLIQSFNKKLNLSNAQINPYMSLTYLHSMSQIPLKKQILRKFTLYIIKSINFLIPYVREIVKEKIYYIMYVMNYSLNLKVFHINSWTKKNLVSSLIPKNKINDKRARKFIYFFAIFLKSKPYNHYLIEERLQKMFFRQQLIEGYKYPLLFKKMYKKKLRKYYYVKGNNVQNQFNIQRKYNQLFTEFPQTQ